MLSALNERAQALDERIDVDIAYSDIIKAFDKVSLNKLIFLLENTGVHPRLAIWLRNFITNRSYKVRVNESFSEPLSVTRAVPQGALSTSFQYLPI